jgi:chromosome partitioning protein
VAQVVSFIIQKGGCGKTTTTVNTAGYLAGLSFKVLCVDMDPQGNLTQHFGYDAESIDLTILDVFQKSTSVRHVLLKRSPLLHVLPNNLRTAKSELELQKSLNREYLLRDAISPVMADYDFIFIDCPPTLGLLSINALAASTEFLLVVAPEFFPMKAIKPLYESSRKVKAELNRSLQFNGVLMTMCDFRTRHSQEIWGILRQNFPKKLYQSYIRTYGQTIFEYKPRSIGAFDYQNFTEEFIKDHHKNVEKRNYYQQKFKSLPVSERNQIIMFAKKNLSNFIKESLDIHPEKFVIQQALIVERNRVLEKLFPYRSNV